MVMQKRIINVENLPGVTQPRVALAGVMFAITFMATSPLVGGQQPLGDVRE